MFGERLKSLREDSDLTQLELAKVLNIAREALSKYETNTREPSFDTVIKIADYFNISLDYLFGRTNVPNPFKK